MLEFTFSSQNKDDNYTRLSFSRKFLSFKAVRVKERDERKENMLMKNIHEFADSGTQEKQRGFTTIFFRRNNSDKGLLNLFAVKNVNFVFVRLKSKFFLLVLYIFKIYCRKIQKDISATVQTK